MALITLLGNVNQNVAENKILKTLFPNRIHVNRLIDYISVCVSYQKRRRGKKSGRMEEVHTGDTFPRAFCFLGSDSRCLQRDSSSTVSTRTGLPQNELKCASTFGSHKLRTNFWTLWKIFVFLKMSGEKQIWVAFHNSLMKPWRIQLIYRLQN